MPLKVGFPLHIIVRRTSATELIPLILTSKASGKIGLAAFEELDQARVMSDGWEPDAEVTALSKTEFLRVVDYFSRTSGVTHVALNAAIDNEDKAIWIPTAVLGP